MAYHAKLRKAYANNAFARKGTAKCACVFVFVFAVALIFTCTCTLAVTVTCTCKLITVVICVLFMYESRKTIHYGESSLRKTTLALNRLVALPPPAFDNRKNAPGTTLSNGAKIKIIRGREVHQPLANHTSKSYVFVRKIKKIAGPQELAL